MDGQILGLAAGDVLIYKIGMQKKRGGRPTKIEGEALDVPVLIRMTQTLRAKLKRLGGADWVRDRIRKAKEPPLDGEK